MIDRRPADAHIKEAADLANLASPYYSRTKAPELPPNRSGGWVMDRSHWAAYPTVRNKPLPYYNNSPLIFQGAEIIR